MAINGYRTIPTDGSGELYSWPGCVVLVSSGWSDGAAFADRVARTDHDDAALAFRDLAGWLLARSGDTVADFAAVLQTGSSLLCMAAGSSEVLVGDGRRVVADVSGMWAQLVLAQQPDRIELGVSAGLAPDRVDLEHGVVPADGVLLIPGGGESPGSVAGAAATSSATGPATSGEASGGTAGSPEPAASPVDAGSASDQHPSAALSQPPVSAPEVGGDVQPPAAQPAQSGAGSGGVVAAPGTVAPASAGSQRVAATERPTAGDAASDAAPEESDASEGGPGSDPRGSPGAVSGGSGQSRHQLPFDAEFGSQPTDADGLVGLVSEEPEPSGTSGSATPATARSAGQAGDEGVERPEPTGEHLSASTFTENGEPDGPPIDDQSPAGEATGLVPIVTTPSVPGGMVSGSSGGGTAATSTTEAPGRSHHGSAPPPPDDAWPPPPAWAPGGGAASDASASDDQDADARGDKRLSGDPRPDDPEFGDDPFADDSVVAPASEDVSLSDEPWAGDWAVSSDVGAADADLVTGEPADDDGSDEDSASEDEGTPKDDTNERDWDSDGLDDDQSIPLLLFDDGVAVELPGDVLIGRRPDPGVRDDPSRLHTLTMTDDSQAVSRNHVELRRRLDEVSIVDCGSANGTFVEATPGELTRLEAEAPHVLRDGERVVFGKRWFEYRAPRPTDSDE